MEIKNLDKAKYIMLDILKEVDEVCSMYELQYWLDFGTLLGAIRHKGFIPWDDDIDISMPRKDYNKFIEVAPKILPTQYLIQHPDTDKDYKLGWVKIRHKNSLFLEFGEDRKKGSKNKGVFLDIFPVDGINKKDKLRYNFLKRIYQINPNKRTYRNKKTKFLHKTFGFLTVLKPTISRYFDSYILNDQGSQYVLGKEMWMFKNYPKNWIFPLQKREFEGNEYWVPNNFDKLLKLYYGNYMELPKVEDRVTHTDTIEIYEEIKIEG